MAVYFRIACSHPRFSHIGVYVILSHVVFCLLCLFLFLSPLCVCLAVCAQPPGFCVRVCMYVCVCGRECVCHVNCSDWRLALPASQLGAIIYLSYCSQRLSFASVQIKGNAWRFFWGSTDVPLPRHSKAISISFFGGGHHWIAHGFWTTPDRWCLVVCV